MTQTGPLIVGAYEHPCRTISDLSLAQVHAHVAMGALLDAGLRLSDVDGYFCDSTVPGGPLAMVEYLGLRCAYVESTDIGGSSYLAHVHQAMTAIADGRCRIALCTMAGRPRSAPPSASSRSPGPEGAFETSWGLGATVQNYALVAMRHMYEFGTTGEDMANVKVAASLHAQHNPEAFLPHPVTIDEVLDSPMISDPLHRMDCCVVTDGGGAVVIVDPAIARSLGRDGVQLLGFGEAIKHAGAVRPDLSYSAAVWSGPAAFVEAKLTPADVDYASIYDSFTITVLMTLEDLGFCEKGAAPRFIADGALLAPNGRLPMNTDGGSLCNNHPGNRGGMIRLIEAVRQLRGEARSAVQVDDCEVALVHGTGGRLGSRSSAVTLLLGRQGS